MAGVVWTDDGPEGSEEVVFSKNGIRLSLVDENGKLQDFDHWDLEMFGGVLPNVGDRIVTLWTDKPKFDPEDHMRVLGRYYVGEFAGDNCWWLICAFEPPTAREMQLYRLHKRASAQSRKDAVAVEKSRKGDYTSLLEIRTKSSR